MGGGMFYKKHALACMVDSLIALLGGFEHNCLEQNAFHTPRS